MEVGWNQLPALEDESEEPPSVARVLGNSDDRGGIGALGIDNSGNIDCSSSYTPLDLILVRAWCI